MTRLKAEDIIGKTVLVVFPKIKSYWIDTYGQVDLTGKPIRLEEFSTEIGE